MANFQPFILAKSAQKSLCSYVRELEGVHARIPQLIQCASYCFTIYNVLILLMVERLCTYIIFYLLSRSDLNIMDSLPENYISLDHMSENHIPENYISENARDAAAGKVYSSVAWGG